MDKLAAAYAQAQQHIILLEEELHCVRAQLRRTVQEQEAAGFRIRETALSTFIAQVPAAVAMLDRRLCYLAASRRWMEIYHPDREDVLGTGLTDIFPIREEKWNNLLQRALAGESMRCEAECFQRADGAIEWIWCEMLPWRQLDGSIGGIIIMSEIITEQKQLAAALSESRNMLQLVLDTIPVRVFWKDTAERYLGANMLFARDAGVVSPAELDRQNRLRAGLAPGGGTISA